MQYGKKLMLTQCWIETIVSKKTEKINRQTVEIDPLYRIIWVHCAEK